jgi:hypothetical protein
MRGNSLGVNGSYHDPNLHMTLTADLPSVKHTIDESTAMNHKLWMNGKNVITTQPERMPINDLDHILT